MKIYYYTVNSSLNLSVTISVYIIDKKYLVKLCTFNSIQGAAWEQEIAAELHLDVYGKELDNCKFIRL